MIGFLLFSSKSNCFVLKGSHNVDDLGSFCVNLTDILSADSRFLQNLVTPGVSPGSVDRADKLSGSESVPLHVAVLNPSPSDLPEQDFLVSVTDSSLSVIPPSNSSIRVGR